MFSRLLDRLEEILISSLMAAATLLIFVAVVHRYGLGGLVSLMLWTNTHGMPGVSQIVRSIYHVISHWNLTWVQELCIYMFVWMAKFGAAYGVRTGIHVGVDVLLNRTTPPSRSRIILFGLLSGAMFTAIVGALGARFVWHIAHTNQTSADLEVPMWIVYLAVPLGSFLMCFRFLQVAYVFRQRGELPSHDPGHVAGLNDTLDTPPSVSPRSATKGV